MARDESGIGKWYRQWKVLSTTAARWRAGAARLCPMAGLNWLTLAAYGRVGRKLLSWLHWLGQLSEAERG